MYDTSDPRSMLAPAPVKPAPFEFAAADCGKFYETAPQENDGNGKSWYIRSQNTIVIYSDAADGARLVREAQADEYVLLLPERNVSAEVTTAAGTLRSPAIPLSSSRPAAARSGSPARARWFGSTPRVRRTSPPNA
jgi:hypothetical protein